MTTSSAQEPYSITLTDDQLSALTSTISLDTITLSPTPYTNSYSIGGASTVTYTGVTSTISSIDWGLTITEEWVNSFPDWSRIEAMCKEYPGLKIAFDKFKTTYYLVKDDYDTPKDKK